MVTYLVDGPERSLNEEATSLEISLHVIDLTMGEGFESDEWGGAWLQITGTLYGNDGGDY